MNTNQSNTENRTVVFRNLEEFRREYLPSATAREIADDNNEIEVDAQLLARRVLSAISSASSIQ